MTRIREPTMATELRWVDGDDWRLWRKIRLRSLLELPDAFGSTYDAEVAFAEADWRQRLEQGPRVLVLTDGRPVAIGGGFRLPGDRLMVFGMWTDPDHRGRGHARAVLEAVVGWARARGLAVELHVNVANPAARTAYERYGFVATGELEPLRPGSEQMIELMRLPDVVADAGQMLEPGSAPSPPNQSSRP